MEIGDQRSEIGVLGWRSEVVERRSAIGDWGLEILDRRLEIGDWRSEIGDQRLISRLRLILNIDLHPRLE